MALDHFKSWKLLLILVLLCLNCSQFVSFGTKDDQSECLRVTRSEFNNSIKTTIDAIKKVISILSRFGKALGDFRLSNAVSDCLDLLDSSADELSWSLSAIQNPKGTLNPLIFTLSYSILFHFNLCFHLLI